MAAWLYQMTRQRQGTWSPERYRLEVWEGKTVTWGREAIRWGAQSDIRRGDLIICYFCPTGGKGTPDYGIYGWGIISGYNKRKEQISFKVLPPSDYLKISVCIDDEVNGLIRKIRKGERGRDPEQLTMYDISFDQLEELRFKIRDHMSAVQPQERKRRRRRS